MKIFIVVGANEAFHLCNLLRQQEVHKFKFTAICLSPAAYDVMINLGITECIIPQDIQGLHSTIDLYYVTNSPQEITQKHAKNLQALGILRKSNWDELYIEQLAQEIHLTKKIGAILSKIIKKHGMKAIILRSNIKSDYSIAGGFVANLLGDTMISLGINVDYIDYNRPQTNPYTHLQIIANKLKQDNTKPTYLNAATAVAYANDVKKLNFAINLVRARGAKVINYSQPFHFTFTCDETEPISCANFLQSKVGRLYTRIKEESNKYADDLITLLLGSKITDNQNPFFSAQRAHFANRSDLQSACFLYLSEIASQGQLSGAILSLHDGGLNGPIYSACEAFNLPTITVPHSSIFNRKTESPTICVTDYRQPTEIKDMSGHSNTCIYTRNSQKNFEVRTQRPNVRNNCATLLLNGVGQEMPGIISINEIRNIYQNVATLLNRNSWDMFTRLKPGPIQTPPKAYNQLIGIDYSAIEAGLSMSLEEINAKSDLIICLGQPTTALLDALEQDTPCFCIVPQRLLSTQNQFDDIFPRYDLDGALNYLKQLITSTGILSSLATKQRSKLKKLSSSREIFTL